MEERVQILLSTYNGEKYLPQLLDSLLSQDYQPISILIRDDGSANGTLDILRQYEKILQIEVIYGENRGVISSFFSLLEHASDAADYYAFCDQDDIWLKNKISRAISHLSSEAGPKTPAMYCSRLAIVDDHLKIKGYSSLPRRGPSLCNALVQNIASGCTMVLNSAARRCLLQKLPHHHDLKMYDWWIYLVISALGKVIYDPEPSVLYRQHSANVIGMPVKSLQLWKTRLDTFRRQGHEKLLRKQARALLDIYADQLSAVQLDIFQEFIKEKNSWVERLKYALHNPLYRHTVIENLLLRFLIVFNRI